jgi:hypothetical protein
VGSWSQFFYISRSDNEDMTMMLWTSVYGGRLWRKKLAY